MTSIVLSQILTLSLMLLLLFSFTSTVSSFRPKALLLPTTKDTSTHQYLVKINQRTPTVSIPVTLDLGAQFLWVDCDHNYVSSTYCPARCKSAQCSLANSKSCGTCNAPRRPGCNNNTCGLFPENPFTNSATSGELASDVVKIQSTDGSNPSRVVTVAKFLFVCGPSSLTKGLAQRAQGVAGFGRTKISIPSQFSAAFSFARKFAICLPSRSSDGVIFFGDGPYNLDYQVDASTELMYTPLLINPVSTGATSFQGERSSEYFIGVTAIKIGDKEVPNINKSLLSIDSKGNGGTKISTVKPYTVMQTSIYKAVTEFFVKQVTYGTRVGVIGPFKVCYNSSTLPYTKIGPFVPDIDLVLQSKDVYWKIAASNSLVSVNDGKVYCLGFVDGGVSPTTAIVIGGYQLEDNLLQFDLARSRLGFSSSLLFRRTTCSNFNFTST